MTASRCDYLDQSHASLRTAPALRTLAVHALFEAALRCSARVRLEFDRARLLDVLGAATTAALLPSLPAHASANGPLERHEEPLDDERARLLRRVVSFEREAWSDPPINYIESVLLFDARGKVVLRASESAESILFALPEEERAHLIDRYRAAGIPAAVIETLDVDIDQGV